MSTGGLLLTGLAALLTAAGNLAMRAGVVETGGLSMEPSAILREIGQLARQPTFDVGVALYGLASLVWFRIVSTESLSSSYPVLVSITFLMVTAGAGFFFREPLQVQKLVGIGVVLAGIILIATAK
jgi:multidrug transporter EmrE-like cation transporter